VPLGSHIQLLGVTYNYWESHTIISSKFQPQKTSSTKSQISLVNGFSKTSLTPSKMPKKLSLAPHLPVNKSTRKQHVTIVNTSDFLEKRQKLKISKAKRGWRRHTISTQE